uniref:Uncharacterized protein n=1 Tax=Rhizophora mucronata TaxID=61149 RepID=A0A2P2QQW4_RHIMU
MNDKDALFVCCAFSCGRLQVFDPNQTLLRGKQPRLS